MSQPDNRSIDGQQTRRGHLKSLALGGLGLLAAGSSVGCNRRPAGEGLTRFERWKREHRPTRPSYPLTSRLRLLIWRDCLDPRLLEKFAEDYKVELDVAYFENNSELKTLAETKPDAFDLLMPSDYVVQRFVRRDLIAPLNKANLPNLGNVSPLFFDSPYDPELQYSVPLFHSYLGVTFNREAVRYIPKTFNLRMPSPEEDLLMYGYRALLDEPRVALTAALMDDGVGPNEATAQTLQKATDRLINETGELGIRYLASQLPSALARNEIKLAVNWSGGAAVALKSNPSIRFVLPSRSKLVQVDGFVIPKASKAKSTAEFFLNFLLEPGVSGALTNYSLYANTVELSRSYVDRDILLGPAYMEPARRERVFITDLGPLEDEFEAQWKRLRLLAPKVTAKVPLPPREDARTYDAATAR
jgi:spermidine/putrescine-binding protein